MEIVDLTKYNIAYEIQCIELMIEALKPFIHFSINSYGNIDIRRRGKGVMKEGNINGKDYIHFIQKTFPNIIDDEIKQLNELSDDEKVKKITFIDIYKRMFGQETSIHSTQSTINQFDWKQKRKYETYKKKFQEMEDSGTINKESEYYKDYGQPNSEYSKKLQEIKERLNYLYNLKKINEKLNGRIKDTDQFLDNLKYYL